MTTYDGSCFWREHPPHWPTVPLRKVARLGTGHTPSRSEPAYWVDCKVPWVTTADLTARTDGGLQPLMETTQHVSELGLANSAAVLHPTDTVMLSRTASIGHSVRIGRPMATTQAFVTWTCGPELDARYLLLVMNAMKPEFDRLAYGSTHLTIYFPDIEQLRVPLPPVSVQTAIADYLDTETARIDALIAKKQRMIELLEERRAALISSSVSRGITGSPLGGEETLTALRRALRPSGISTGLIKGASSSEAEDGFVPGYSASGQDVWLPKATHFGAGLVLSAVGARCGKVFLADGEWSVVANTVVLIPQPGHNPRFLWYLTNNESFWVKGGTAQPYVRVPESLARKVWLPSLTEQCFIADFLDNETAQIDAISSKLNAQVDLLREHRQALITAAVTGELEIPGVAA